MTRTVPVDRIELDGVALRIRSALLQGNADASAAPWSMTVACRRLPDRLAAGTDGWPMRAMTVTGVVLAGEVAIHDRDDDAYGTHLRIAAVPPAATAATGRADVSARELQP